SIYRCLKRHGLIELRRRRKRRDEFRRWERERPMQLWQMDVMGGVELGRYRALNGGRAELTESELESVGATVHVHDTSGGWHQPNTAPYELSSILSAEDTELLQALMNAGSSDRVEFLG
ncbi:MAG TPA: hypothetical protein VF195_04020, partial [Actinomycetota bacterium]